MEQAVTGCIREGILEEFLRRNRSEAMKVSIYEYDAEKHLRMEREEAREDGYRNGQADGYRQGQKDLQKKFISAMLKNGKTISQIAADLEEDEQIIQELIRQLPEYGGKNYSCIKRRLPVAVCISFLLGFVCRNEFSV